MWQTDRGSTSGDRNCHCRAVLRRKLSRVDIDATMVKAVMATLVIGAFGCIGARTSFAEGVRRT